MPQSQASWKKKFFAIYLGQLASMAGSYAVQFALIWWIASETGSAVMMGLAGLAGFLPSTLLSPLAGIAADRLPRKYICITADLFIGSCAALFALLLWRFDLPVWSAVVILFIRSMGSAFHQPAFRAMIPQFVPADQPIKAGGWDQLIASGSFLLGPALGAGLYAAFPLAAVLLTDLAGAVIASVLLALVPVPQPQAVPHESQTTRGAWAEGLAIFRSDRVLLRLIAVETLCMIFYMPLSSFYPLMTSSYFHASAWHGSAVQIFYAVGMMTAAFLFGSVVQVKRLLLVSYIGLVGIGVCAAVGGLLPPTMWAWFVFALACGVMGAFGNVHGVPLVAYMQTTIPPEKLGRAFAFTNLLSSLTMPLGLVIASPLAEWLGVNVWFLIAGAAITGISLAGLLLRPDAGK